jgi:hypothetical protein
MNITNSTKHLASLSSLFLLSACVSNNATWTQGQWAAVEYTTKNDECGLKDIFEGLDSALVYTLGEGHEEAGTPFDTGGIRSNDSGLLSENDIAKGLANLWDVCRTPSPNFSCDFALETLHQDSWLTTLRESACPEGSKVEIRSDTRGLLLNTDELLTNSWFQVECENTTTGEWSEVCESNYSTRLRSKSGGN